MRNETEKDSLPLRVMRAPRSIDIAITNQCNLRCKYCSHFSGPGDVSQDLPKKEWLTFFEELKNCAVMSITLEGGEPFHRDDLKEIIQGIVANRMRFSILTNGTMITDEMGSFLASTNRCDSVQVSIDGSDPSTHDTFRDKGSFKRALSGIKLLLEHRISVTVRVTIHKQNIDDLDRVAKLLLEDIGLPGFSTNSAGFMGLCRQFAEQIQLTPEERSQAMKALLKLNEKYNNRITSTAGPLSEAEGWKKMEQARKENKDLLPGRGYLTGCHGPMETLAVRADGIMVPCIQLSHIELGRINKEDLLKVWKDHPELQRIRNRDKIPLSDFEFCQDCSYINYCTGNCPALAYTIAGEVNHPSPDACLKRFLEQGGKLPD